MDFVILWVDNNDKSWQSAFKENILKEKGVIINECRYRDWDNLKYWFRAIEKYANWVNRIFLITDNQIPSWIDTNNPKLRIVFHEEFIPHDLLPVYNSATIDLFLNRIPDLSEEFVYFNDDFFITSPITPERFFRNGLPCDMSSLNAYDGHGRSCANLNAVELINKNFPKCFSFRKHFFKWFSVKNGIHNIRTFLLMWWPNYTGFFDHHLPQPFLKSTWDQVWEKEEDSLIASCSRFREKKNINQYIMRYWQLASGKYININPQKDSICFQLDTNNVNIAARYIVSHKKKIITLNDNESTDFEYCKPIINNAFNSILPEKCSFEI